MNWKFINIPLGASAPFGSSEKDIAPVVLAGIIAGGSALVGSALNYFSNQNANNANADMNAETNETNMLINEHQIAAAQQMYENQRVENRQLVDQAYQRSIADRENERAYNSPAAQAQRLREAGINPALALGNGSLGGVSSTGTTNSVGNPAQGNVPAAIPAQNGAPMKAFDYGSGISQAAQTFLSALDIQNKQKATDFDIAARMNEQEMEYFKYLDDHANSAYEHKLIDAKIREMDQNMTYQKNQFAKAVEWQNFQKYVQEYQLAQKDSEIQINQYLAQSKVMVDKATVSNLAQLVNESKQRVFEMSQNGASQRAIDSYIEQEKAKAVELLDIELGRKRRNDVPGSFYRSWKDVCDWMFEPIKGIVSVGLK